MISAVAEEKDVVRCWIPLQKAQRHGLGTLEFQLKDRRIRFQDVEEGDVVTCHILSHLVTSCHILSHLVTVHSGEIRIYMNPP